MYPIQPGWKADVFGDMWKGPRSLGNLRQAIPGSESSLPSPSVVVI